jgi:hypothetical protein
MYDELILFTSVAFFSLFHSVRLWLRLEQPVGQTAFWRLGGLPFRRFAGQFETMSL